MTWENSDKNWPQPPPPPPPFRVGDTVRCIDPINTLRLDTTYIISEVYEHMVHVSTIKGTSFYADRFEKIESPPEKDNAVRKFSTGATRNLDLSKFDYEGFLSPSALLAFGQYMHSHRKQADGTVRDSDNWQKGIPDDVYVKSMFRHFFDVWALHRGLSPLSPEDNHPVTLTEALCALLFNVQGLLHETLKKEPSCPTESL